MTMLLPVLNQARQLAVEFFLFCFLVSSPTEFGVFVCQVLVLGSGKADVLEEINNTNDPVSASKFPITHIAKNKLGWFVDREAAKHVLVSLENSSGCS